VRKLQEFQTLINFTPLSYLSTANRHDDFNKKRAAERGIEDQNPASRQGIVHGKRF
jgi:hypothetical protein